MISRVSEEAVKLDVEGVKPGTSSDPRASGPNNCAHSGRSRALRAMPSALSSRDARRRPLRDRV